MESLGEDADDDADDDAADDDEASVADAESEAVEGDGDGETPLTPSTSDSEIAGDAEAAADAAEATPSQLAFRVGEIGYHGPHAYVSDQLGCQDVTAQVLDPERIAQIVLANVPNAPSRDQVTAESLVMLFDGEQGVPGQSAMLSIEAATCTASAQGTHCSSELSLGSMLVRRADSKVCRHPAPGFNMAPVNESDGCFASDEMTIELSVGGEDVVVKRARVGGFVDNQLTAIDGFAVAFLPQSEAERLVFGADLPELAGTTLAAALSSECGEKQDAGDDEPGYWLNFNYEALLVDWN